MAEKEKAMNLYAKFGDRISLDMWNSLVDLASGQEDASSQSASGAYGPFEFTAKNGTAEDVPKYGVVHLTTDFGRYSPPKSSGDKPNLFFKKPGIVGLDSIGIAMEPIAASGFGTVRTGGIVKVAVQNLPSKVPITFDETRYGSWPDSWYAAPDSTGPLRYLHWTGEWIDQENSAWYGIFLFGDRVEDWVWAQGRGFSHQAQVIKLNISNANVTWDDGVLTLKKS